MNLITLGLWLAACLVQGQPGATSSQNRPHPQDRDVLVHRVTPGGEVTHIATFERSGVPCIVSLGGDRLMAAHQWFPADIPEQFDHIAVHFSEDGGQTWGEPTPIEVQGLPVRTRFPFDPTIVRLDDGRLRMYFTSMQGRIMSQSTPWIGSAISSDGIRWTFERGRRFEVEGSPTIDCAVARLGATWHMIVPFKDKERAGAYHAQSRDGLLFDRQPDLAPIGLGKQWLGCLVARQDTLRFYGTSIIKQLSVAARNAGLWTADLQQDGSWKAGPSLKVPGADPGVVELEDGTLVVVTTGPARPGTPSARPRRQQSPPSVPASSKADIDRRLNDLITSANNLDWDGFSNTFSPGATAFVSTPAIAKRLESGTEVRSTFQPAFDQKKQQDTQSSTWPPLPQNPQNINVQTHGDTAIATFHTDHVDDQQGWWTVVMKRENNTWKVHHLHATVQPKTSSDDTKTSWP